MSRRIEHEILAPDDRTGLIRLGAERKRRNETVQACLARSAVRGPVAPICVINGVPVLRREWATRRIRTRDRVRFCYRLGDMGGGSGRGVAVLSIVALLALSVLAPYAGVGLATAAFGSATAGFAGITYASIFSGITLDGGSILLTKGTAQ